MPNLLMSIADNNIPAALKNIQILLSFSVSRKSFKKQ